MPNGYTSALYEGREVDFREFVLGCARAFGACISLKEEPGGPAPAVVEPSYYHEKSLESARDRLRAYSDLSWDIAADMARNEFEDSWVGWEALCETIEARNHRFGVMMAQVKAWDPPTSEHENLKAKMIEWLEWDIERELPSPPEKPLAREWLARKIKRTADDIDYHSRKWEEEQRRAASRTTWLQQLHDSLPERT
jgi:hypothetical protein